MRGAAFVAGDWGSTRLRLQLCVADGAVIESTEGPGAVAARGRHREVLEELLAGWDDRAAAAPVMLCGMVGSRIGWVETHYVPCPTPPAAVAGTAVPVCDGRVHIVPGLACTNRLGAPDVMRGEETQILGALQLDPQLGRGRRLLCLPGTHTKWVLLADGVVVDFLTAPVGELFELVLQHSALLGGVSGAPLDEPTFRSALEEVGRHPGADTLHRVFACRTRRLRGDLSDTHAGSYLSGLLVGGDVAAALRCFAEARVEDAVCVIGAREPAQPYALAIAGCGRGGRMIDGEAASLAGLRFVYRQLAGSGNLRAAG